jgi:Calcineurin-like phosphoesterase
MGPMRTIVGRVEAKPKPDEVGTARSSAGSAAAHPDLRFLCRPAWQPWAALWFALLLVGSTGRAMAEPLRVAVISDLNGNYGSTEYESTVDGAVRRIVEMKPDLVISTGDMVAGQRRPHLSRSQVETMWGSFHAHVSDPLAQAGIPLAVTPGNHDGSAYDGFELERQIYGEQWSARKPAVTFVDAVRYPYYYAFAAGDVLFVSLDATTLGELPPGQTAWLKDLLARHGGRYKQRVVFSHVPLWPFAQRREHDYIGDPALEQVLHEGHVDLYLSGHHHAFYPGHKDGIHLVSQSCAGAGPRRLIGSDVRSPRAITLIEVDGPQLRLAALQEPDFTQPIDWRSLPARIRSKAAELIRADLVQDRLEELPVRAAAALPP